MNNETLKIICNPRNHNILSYKSDDKSEFLLDIESGERFPILNGIPSFINSENIEGFNKNSADFYNSYSLFYELVQKFYYSFWGGEVKARNDYLKHLEIDDGNKVLEVSVGTGANIRILPRNAQYYGLDISYGQLNQCHKNIKKYGMKDIELFWGEAENLPFQDETFDVVYHVGGINVFNDKKRALEEMIRVAKKGTKILIADETEKVAKFYDKLPYFNKPFKNRKEPITPPINLLPLNVSEVELFEIRKGTLYCLVFRKL